MIFRVRMVDRGEHQEAVRARLKALPEALGFPSATTLAAALGVAVSTWNQSVSTGTLSRSIADRLRARFGLGLPEWVWWGQRAMVSDQLLRKLDAAMGAPASRKGITRGA